MDVPKVMRVVRRLSKEFSDEQLLVGEAIAVGLGLIDAAILAADCTPAERDEMREIVRASVNKWRDGTPAADRH